MMTADRFPLTLTTNADNWTGKDVQVTIYAGVDNAADGSFRIELEVHGDRFATVMHKQDPEDAATFGDDCRLLTLYAVESTDRELAQGCIIDGSASFTANGICREVPFSESPYAVALAAAKLLANIW